jgi:hypothetical protein
VVEGGKEESWYRGSNERRGEQLDRHKGREDALWKIVSSKSLEIRNYM